MNSLFKRSGISRFADGMRRSCTALSAAALLVALAACAAPQTESAAAAKDAPPVGSEVAVQPIAAAPPASAPADPSPPPRSKPAPPMSDPLPPQRVPDSVAAPGGAASKPNTACKTNADCVVKDVGNCCGYYPQCVNVDAAVDPKAVQARCASQGMASVCGFPVIEGCQCVKGQCAADAAGAVDR